MLDYRDAEDVACFDEGTRHLPVVLRVLRLPARVIVKHDYLRRLDNERHAEDGGLVDDDLVYGAERYEDRLLVHPATARVERNNPTALVRLVLPPGGAAHVPLDGRDRREVRSSFHGPGRRQQPEHPGRYPE